MTVQEFTVSNRIALMLRRASICVLFLLAVPAAPLRAQAPEFDLLIKGGHVIDPKNSVDGVVDVAVANGKIALVQANIPPARARAVADATGLYVTPGLIDIHAHVFWGHDETSQYSDGYSAVQPDSHSFRAGQTTLVDVGGAGWRSFPKFKEQVIDRSRTRVLAFLNIVGDGMRGGPVEQNLADMDAKLTAMRIRQHKELIVGVKVAHYNGPEWDPVTRAVAAGTETNVPVMVDFGGHTPPLSLEELLMKHLRPGDILTHTYAHVGGRIPIVDEQDRVRPYVLAARKRGIIFDAGHGGGSFLFRQAVPAGEHVAGGGGDQARRSRPHRRRRRSRPCRAQRAQGEVRVHRRGGRKDDRRPQARMRADGEGRAGGMGSQRNLAAALGDAQTLTPNGQLRRL
jgi:dihydroorotase